MAKNKESLRKKFDNKLVRYTIVGIINTIFGSSVMFIAYNIFNFTYWISSALNYILGSILSFFLNKHFTFKSKNKSFTEAIKFALNVALSYFLAYGIAKDLVGEVLIGQSQSVQENLAMLVGMFLYVGLNFLGQNFFVFKDQEK